MSALCIRDLHVHYGAIAALKGVSLDVQEGEIVSLIGANGAGKTTLLSSICANPKPTSGDIVVFGTDISAKESHELAAMEIAICPEGRHIFSRMTVYENLQMGAWLMPRARFLGNIERVFTLFPRLKERLKQIGGTLSGGEQQMLTIGRALMSEPKLLLLDEPSLGLAPQIRQLIFNALLEINEEFGTTILLAEQDAHHALKISSRGYVLATGKVVLSGNSNDLLVNADVRSAYLEGGGKAIENNNVPGSP